jgi:hypothetical protein
MGIVFPTFLYQGARMYFSGLLLTPKPVIFFRPFWDNQIEGIFFEPATQKGGKADEKEPSEKDNQRGGSQSRGRGGGTTPSNSKASTREARATEAL